MCVTTIFGVVSQRFMFSFSCGETKEINFSAVELQVKTIQQDSGSEKCFTFQSEATPYLFIIHIKKN